MSQDNATIGQLLLDEFIRIRELFQQQLDRDAFKSTLPDVSSRIASSETLVQINNVPADPPLCTADPRRWLLAFSSPGTGGFIASNRAPDGTTGLVSLSGNPIVLDYAKWGNLVQNQWFGIGISGAISITVYQVWLLPAR